MPSFDTTCCPTLPHWIGRQAERTGKRIALVFVTDEGERIEWTYGELWDRSLSVAGRLPAARSDSSPQDAPRALLLFPPGLEFMAGFLGAQIAGYIPVPTAYPKPNRRMPRLDSAAEDCRPAVLISDVATLSGLADDKMSDAAGSIPRLATDAAAAGHPDDQDDATAVGSSLCFSMDERLGADTIAFLQYTSGSTSDPKGVLVRHRNLMANLESIRRGFHIKFVDDDDPSPDRGVFWLPFFHDMGLIGGILEPLYVGGTTVLMSPRAFLQRPIRWLELISQERATISGAPNFAYQLAVDRVTPDQTDDLDLSNWKNAFCGAEPIVPRTLSDFANRFSSCGFARDAFYPCYGLAEATLLAAGGDGPAVPDVIKVSRSALGEGVAEIRTEGRGSEFVKLVSCGQAAHDTELLIVDPETCRPVESDTVGEIWIRGEGVTDGYWNREDENRSQFQARLDASVGDRGAGFCRTGDLGFRHDGSLYITGRRKDVIVLRGRNHYPQDIEATVRQAVPGDGGQIAAFAIEAPRGEALVLAVELPRRSDRHDYPNFVRAIRRAVIEAHEIDPSEVVLVRQATVPLTSSGKVQRGRCRELFLADELKAKHHYRRVFAGEHAISLPDLPDSPEASDHQMVIESIEAWLVQWLTLRAGVTPGDIELDKPFADYGLDSMTAVELSGEIEDWSGIEVTPTVALNYPTVSRLSRYITDQWIGQAVAPQADSAGVGSDDHDDEQTQPSDEFIDELEAAELEGLLDEIEGLTEDQINHALADKRSS